MKREHYIQGRLFGDAEPGNSITFPKYEDRIKTLQGVIKNLRKSDLGSGHCFLIFGEQLEENEAFYEYPDGRISIERLNKNNIDIPRELVRVLTAPETKALRKRNAIIR